MSGDYFKPTRKCLLARRAHERAGRAFHDGSAKGVKNGKKGKVKTVPENSGLEGSKDELARNPQELRRGPFAINGGLDTLRT